MAIETMIDNVLADSATNFGLSLFLKKPVDAAAEYLCPSPKTTNFMFNAVRDGASIFGSRATEEILRNCLPNSGYQGLIIKGVSCIAGSTISKMTEQVLVNKFTP